MTVQHPFIKKITFTPTASAVRRHKIEAGACPFCDRERAAGNDFHPSHDASPRCESGKRPHCTCDTCF